jgi:hypothetical protein
MPIQLSCLDTPDLSKEKLSFSICENCNTIQLDKLIKLHILYSISHNTVSFGKVWEGYFQLFCKTIQNMIIDRNILEIGDPSGRIANACSGFSNWYIIEPNKNENIVFKENIHFISDFFDEDFVFDVESIDLIIHSHVFEHIYSPNMFLKKCHEILVDDGEMIFGIPNMEYIALNELAPCLGIFFEHTIFLNKENVSGMLIQNGFKIIEIIHYENHSIIYHVKKIKKIKHDSGLSNNYICITNYRDLFMNTIHKWTSFIEKCPMDTFSNIYLFGASYNTQYLLALGLNHSLEKISGILDNCKEKQGKYLSGFSIKIFSPDILLDLSLTLSMNNNSCILSDPLSASSTLLEHSIHSVTNHEKSSDFIGKTSQCGVFPSKELKPHFLEAVLTHENDTNNVSNCLVIIKNGYYTNEISEQLKNINKNVLIIK